jgi:hypothetical protein
VYRGGDEVVVAEGEIIDDDLIAGGRVVRVDGIVKGDLVAAGRDVIINGGIEGDLIAMGQSLIINGVVGDDVRVAGYAVLLGPKARIVDDFFASVFSLEGQPGSRVDGTLHVAGYQALLAGLVEENVVGALGALELRGVVGGDVAVEVGGGGDAPSIVYSLVDASVEVPRMKPGLRLLDGAKVGGDLGYSSPVEGEVAEGAVIAGELDFSLQERSEARVRGGGFSLATHMRRFITVFAVGLVLLWLAPGWVSGLVERVKATPLMSLGYGAAVTVAVALAAAVVAAVSALAAGLFGSLSLGGLAPPFIGVGLLIELALLTPFLIVAVYVPPVLVSYGGGRMALERFRPDWRGGKARSLAIGIVFYVILRAIPGVGTAVAVLVLLFGVGAVALWLRDLLEGDPREVRPV